MNYRFIGWCREDNHDKVWVAIRVGPECVTVWGRRGGKLQHQVVPDDQALSRRIIGKINKGYACIDPLDLDTVYPEFHNDLEAAGVVAMLSR